MPTQYEAEQGIREKNHAIEIALRNLMGAAENIIEYYEGGRETPEIMILKEQIEAARGVLK